MVLETGLDLYENSLTNNDVTVTYVPDTNVINYSYKVIKDNEIIDNQNILSNKESVVTFDKTGNYQLEITTYNGNTYNTITSGLYEIDKEAPIINIKNSVITIKDNQHIDVMDGVKAIDNVDGDITNSVKTNIDDINFKSSNQKLVYTVSDEAGNQISKTVELNIVKSNNFLLFSQILIISILVIFLIASMLYNRTLKLEKRLSKYTLKPLKNNSKSLFETFIQMNDSIVNKITSFISKSEVASRQSLRYEKYVKAFKLESPIKFIAQKIFISLIFLLSGFIIITLRFQTLNIYETFILLITGYYVLDMIYKYKYYIYCKNVENDLLQAIVIMKSAFKSGRSITQAVDLVGNELNGPISDEFKKISTELNLGLDVDVAFRRFAERINIEEVAYLTSSLSILNQTGGNIVKVFSSIEETLFNRKKLRIELKELTGSSRLIMWVLTVVPIVFVMLISIVNPEYFQPLFVNFLGFIIIGAIILLYVVYIIVVRKIMKIRM